MTKARYLSAVFASFTVAAGSLAALEACSSDNGTVATPAVTPVAEASTPKTDSSDNSPDASAGEDSSVTDAGSDCGTAPTLHPAKPDGGMYCPFSAPTGGKNIYCAENQQCCENPAGGGVSTCEAVGTACPVAAATVWECQDPLDCVGSASGTKCCAHSAAAGAVTVATDTCGPYLSKFSGTHCATACAAGELQVCEKPADCTTGTCTAVKPKGNAIGVCN
jgi:hypothetical protein